MVQTFALLPASLAPVDTASCGAKHANADTMSLFSFAIGSAVTSTGYGIVDEDVSAFHSTVEINVDNISGPPAGIAAQADERLSACAKCARGAAA